MAQGNGIRLAAEEIEKALNAFVHESASAKAQVFETEYGHLRALLGHGAFETMSPVERQELIWEYLEKTVDADLLKYLYAVHAMDLDEYDRQTHDVNP